MKAHINQKHIKVASFFHVLCLDRFVVDFYVVGRIFEHTKNSFVVYKVCSPSESRQFSICMIFPMFFEAFEAPLTKHLNYSKTLTQIGFMFCCQVTFL